MQYRIRRTKTAGESGKQTTTVSYATAVGPGGRVSGWTADPGSANPVSEEAAKAVAAHYAGRGNAGRIEALPADGPGGPIPLAPAAEGGKAAAAGGGEDRRLRAERDEAVAALKDAAARIADLEKRLKTQADRAEESQGLATAATEKAAGLAARVAELEGELAKAAARAAAPPEPNKAADPKAPPKK